MDDTKEDVQFFKNSSRKLNHRYLETQSYESNRTNQKVITKWSQNTLYNDVKKRIHEKIKTQTTNQDLQYNFPINPQFHHIKKPKSKIFVSTLQIAIDPLMRKIIQEPFPIDRKILHKPQQKIQIITNRQKSLSRNMSAKITRQINQPNSIIRKQKIQTCRKNTKSSVIFTTTSKSFKPKQLSEVKSTQLIQKVNQNSQNRYEKSKSQMTKRDQAKKFMNSQQAQINPLLFYFRTKNNIKHSDREMSIKKIRMKSKNNKVFI